MVKPIIYWLRQDLRLHDNPALVTAAEDSRPIIPLFILDESLASFPGAASLWWLHYSLKALGRSYQKLGASLVLRKGDPYQILQEIIAVTGADRVLWNRRYDSPSIKTDSNIKAKLTGQGIECQSFNSHLLFEPGTIKNKQGNYFQVFTRFWDHCLEKQNPPTLLKIPKKIKGLSISSDSLDDWKLLPTKPNWAGGLEEMWIPGEEQALNRLKYFLAELVEDYKLDRNLPQKEATSRLSPHLAWGEISPRLIWYEVMKTIHQYPSLAGGAQHFLSEIGWREFSYHLLFQFPDLPKVPLRPQFLNFPWQYDEVIFNKWTKGQTGYPIIDAGMRELWHTGWMHNRVRMIVASFLIKDLLISWQQGAAWFWDTLVDADIANNSASWQWVAGCGADASPYFRIFNPVLQGEKFDPQGVYVRKWVPELKEVPDDVIHKPWCASKERLAAAGVFLGKTYPLPIVEHEKARQNALEIFKTLKNKTLCA